MGFAALLGCGCSALVLFSGLIQCTVCAEPRFPSPSPLNGPNPLFVVSSLFFTFCWTQSPAWMFITAPCACTGECESWARPLL